MRKGSKMSDCSRAKMSLASKKRVGEKASNWKGGLQKRHGRYYLTVCKERVSRARYVMERHLGRNLTRKEVVHHIDGNKCNDNIDNLQVMQLHIHSSFHLSGEKCHSAKLTNDNIHKIKKMYINGYIYKEIAGKFGVSISTIGNIINNKSWKNI